MWFVNGNCSYSSFTQYIYILSKVKQIKEEIETNVRIIIMCIPAGKDHNVYQLDLKKTNMQHFKYSLGIIAFLDYA